MKKFGSKLEKTVYISKIGVYDKDKNLIAIAKLASPVRKREGESLSIKMVLDMWKKVLFSLDKFR